MATTVMGNGAIAMGGQKVHLILESIRAQRPAMTKHDGLPGTPVVKVDFSAIFAGDRAHLSATPVGVLLKDYWVLDVGDPCHAVLDLPLRLNAVERAARLCRLFPRSNRLEPQVSQSCRGHESPGSLLRSD